MLLGRQDPTLVQGGHLTASGRECAQHQVGGGRRSRGAPSLMRQGCKYPILTAAGTKTQGAEPRTPGPLQVLDALTWWRSKNLEQPPCAALETPRSAVWVRQGGGCDGPGHHCMGFLGCSHPQASRLPGSGVCPTPAVGFSRPRTAQHRVWERAA